MNSSPRMVSKNVYKRSLCILVGVHFLKDKKLYSLGISSNNKTTTLITSSLG